MKIPVEAGIPRWSRAAVELLTETATDYNRVLTTNDFARQVQNRAGAWANVTSKTWVRKVLHVVTLKCVKEGWPHLAALVVRPSDGKPGPWYFDVLAETGPGDAPDEAHHAAAQRLECYRYFGADVPEDAEPAVDALRRQRTVQHLAPKAGAARRPAGQTRAAAQADSATEAGAAKSPGRSTSARSTSARSTSTRSAPTERRGEVCPTCFMEMPVSGVCSNCL